MPDIETCSFDEIKKYNEEYEAGAYRGSEATPFKLKETKWFLDNIRPTYKYVDDPYTNGDWETLDIKQYHSKYGLNYLYIDRKQKLWRWKRTGDEFYGHNPRYIELGETL